MAIFGEVPDRVGGTEYAAGAVQLLGLVAVSTVREVPRVMFGRAAVSAAVVLAGAAAVSLAANGTADAQVLGYYSSFSSCQQSAMYVRTHADGEARCISTGTGRYDVVYTPSTLTERW